MTKLAQIAAAQAEYDTANTKLQADQARSNNWSGGLQAAQQAQRDADAALSAYPTSDPAGQDLALDSTVLRSKQVALDEANALPDNPVLLTYALDVTGLGDAADDSQRVPVGRRPDDATPLDVVPTLGGTLARLYPGSTRSADGNTLTLAAQSSPPANLAVQLPADSMPDRAWTVTM